METNHSLEEDKFKRATKKVKRIKGFYRHLMVYLAVNVAITSAHVIHDMWNGASFVVAFWSMQTFFTWIPWAVGLLIHGIIALDVISFFIGSDWEDRKMKKYMEEDHKKNTMNWE